MLNNRTISYSNIIFWLENHSLINHLINIENGSLKKEWFEGTKYINSGWIFKNVPDNKEYSIEEMLEYNLGIKNIPYFKNYFDRYVRTWYSFFKKGYKGDENEESENSKWFEYYPIDIHVFIWISSLSNKDYNIDKIIEDCIKNYNFHFDLTAYIFVKKMSIKFDVNVEVVEDCIKNIDLCLDKYKIKKETINEEILKEIIFLFPSKVDDYKKGKTNLINLFLGEYLKRLQDKNVDKAMLLTGIKNFIENN